VYTFYNFGGEAVPPLFTFVKDEDLQAGRAERDVKLHQIGWRPNKAYISREYGIPEEDFELAEEQAGEEPFPGFGHDPLVPEKEHPENCPCGCRHRETKHGILKKLTALFASKEERTAARDKKLMKEFSGLMLEKGQEEIDAAIEAYADALGMVDNYEDARAALGSAYGKRSLKSFAHIVDEVRYAAGGIGGSHA
jgi:hypothetical protein